MNLYRINLNLLVALDELLAAQSVTLAAKKLSLTQAAMSNNLQQLREIFKDPLLAREKNYMILTPYAKELRPKLHQVLQEMHSLIVSGQQFDPATSTRLFKIGMSDYVAALLLPKLMNILAQEAPQLRIKIVSDTSIGSIASFERGDYELAVGKTFENTTTLCKQALFTDTGVCILNPHHALARQKTLSLADYVACEHIAVQVDNPLTSRLIEEALAKHNVHRNIKVASPFVCPIIDWVAESPTLVGTVIKRIAELYYDPKRFVMRSLPFEIDPLVFYLLWHPRQESDRGQQWLRERIVQVLGSVNSAVPRD